MRPQRPAAAAIPPAARRHRLCDGDPADTPVTPVLSELRARSADGSAAGALASPVHQYRRQLAPVTAFGVTIADIMLHGRGDDRDPITADWLARDRAPSLPDGGS